MPSIIHKNADAAMDTWDCQRCAVALVEMRDQLALLTTLFKRVSADDLDDWNAGCLDKGMDRVRTAISKFTDETD